MRNATIYNAVVRLLQDGNTHTTQEISAVCGCSHSSAIIRDIKKVFAVQEKRSFNSFGNSVKLFWIDPNHKYIDKGQNDLPLIERLQIKIDFYEQ